VKKQNIATITIHYSPNTHHTIQTVLNYSSMHSVHTQTPFAAKTAHTIASHTARTKTVVTDKTVDPKAPNHEAPYFALGCCSSRAPPDCWTSYSYKSGWV